MLRVADPPAAKSDVGRQREANEDAYFSQTPVFVVADGMGGARAGEVASGIAVKAFEEGRPEDDPPERYLERTVRQANREIHALSSEDESLSGMGTTLTAAILDRDEVSFAHVGDSRAYLFRDGRFEQLTNDHSLVAEWARQGRLTPEQAESHPQRSIITRALGPEEDVEVDTFTRRARDGDLFLLCSDGLTTMLPDEGVVAVLEQAQDLNEAARMLIRAANERGGRDNITVVLFRVEQVEGGSDDEGPSRSEGATLIGPTAAEESLTAEAVRRGAPRAAPDGEPPPRARRPGRGALKALAGLAAVGVLVAGGIIGMRQAWFVGTDDAGRVALFRGLPYELPLGIDLYSEQESIPLTLDAVPRERQDAVTDHQLRSRDDAVDLIEDIERVALEQAERQRTGDRSEPGRDRGGGGGPG